MPSQVSELNVYFLPDLIPDSALHGCVAVVIDILRATTTMTTALAAGARRIVPCLSIEQAHDHRQRLLSQVAEGEQVLLGGERQGKPLPGFDLGNSPETYDAAAVAGNTIVMTTTNGTRAMDMCQTADEIVIGSFANLSAVCHRLRQSEKVAIVCSGTNRHVTSEDVLMAGALVQQLAPPEFLGSPADGGGQNGDTFQANDQARLALAFWNQLAQDHPGAQPTFSQILAVFERSLGGSNLIAQERGGDLAFAAVIDRFDNLPVLDKASWEISNASINNASINKAPITSARNTAAATSQTQGGQR